MSKASNTNLSHFPCASEQKQVDEFWNERKKKKVTWKWGQKFLFLSLDQDVCDPWDHMKTFLLVLSLSVSHFFSFLHVTSWMLIVIFEQTFSPSVYLLSAHQTIFRIFFIFHKLWEFLFVFHFASWASAPTCFQKSGVFLVLCLKMPICWWIKLLL